MQDAFTLAMNRFNTRTGHMERIPNDGIEASTRFMVLNEHKIVFDGSTLELVHTQDPWLKEYLSE